MTSEYFTTFGFKCELDTINWTKIIINSKYNKRKLYKYVFAKTSLLDKLNIKGDIYKDEKCREIMLQSVHNSFIDITNNSDILKYIVYDGDEETKISEGDYISILTDRPFIPLRNYSYDEIFKMGPGDISFYFFEEDKKIHLALSFPYSYESKKGKAIYEYSYDSYEDIVKFLNISPHEPHIFVLIAKNLMYPGYHVPVDKDCSKLKFTYMIKK